MKVTKMFWFQLLEKWVKWVKNGEMGRWCHKENIPGKEPHFKKEIENQNDNDLYSVQSSFNYSDMLTG